jgi:CheY-like chemotaxis protein
MQPLGFNPPEQPLWQKTRILVVEDDPAARHLQIIALRRMYNLWSSCEIVEAGTLAEAELKIKAGPKFDLIVLDLVLPNGRGLMGIERLSHAQAFPPETIVLTGMELDTAYKVQGIRAGASGWVCKADLMRGGTGLDWSPLESEIAKALAVRDRTGPMVIGRARRIAEEGASVDG